MPVPAEADAKKDSNTTTPVRVEQQASNGGALASPAPSAPISAPSNEQAPSPGAEENGPASCSNGGPGVTSPIEMANNGEQSQPHKIFVGGLSWQTSEDKLREIFEGYGEVTEYNIMKDPVTKKSRGFGFVTFKSPDSVKKVLAAHHSTPMSIDEKTIDPKIAIPPKRLSTKVKRIFVGGLSSDSCEEDLRDYFEQFGKVMESQLMYDRNTSRHRGFGFVTFESEEPAEKVCSIQYHDIKGKKVEVKVAQTKEAIAMQQGRGRMISQRNFSNNYGGAYHGHSYTQFYPHHYGPIDLMNMGGYNAPPVMLSGGGAGGKPERGGSKRGYSQYAFPYGPGGWGDHHVAGGFYPAGFGMHMPMMRGHMGMDPAAMDYMAEQFQGLALGGGYYNHSPPSGSQFPAMGGMDHVSSAAGGGSYSPPHQLSPKGIVTSAGYNSVPTYTGSHSNSYAVAQPSY